MISDFRYQSSDIKLFLIVVILLSLVNCPLSLISPSPAYAQETSTPTPTQTITLAPIKQRVNREEEAVYTLNRSLLPSELATANKPSEKNIFSDIGQIFSGFLNRLKFFGQTENFYVSYFPTEFVDKKPIADFLGGEAGIYSVNLPKFEGITETKKAEKMYEKAYFPEGIRPVTGQ